MDIKAWSTRAAFRWNEEKWSYCEALNVRTAKCCWQLQSAATNWSSSQSLENCSWIWSCIFMSSFKLQSDQDVGNEHLLNRRIETWSITSLVIFNTHVSISWNCCRYKKTKTNNGFIRASASGGVLRAGLPCADQIALSLDDAPALHDDGVTEDPLQPPVSRDGVLRALLHRLLECGSWYQLCW